MKTLTVLFTLFYFLNALAVAPYGIKGQQQTQTLYSNVHQFPNNQVTNLGGINALVESGNSNILSNPSFEHSTFSTDWSFSGTASIFEDLTRVLDGKKSSGILAVSQSFALVQDSTLYASQFAGQVQGLAMVRIKANAGATGIKVCSRQAGITSTTNCVDVLANDQWGLYKVPFVLGATSNGISIASTGNTTSVVYIDDAFVGAVDLKQDINNIGPWVNYTPTIFEGLVNRTSEFSANIARWRQVGESMEVEWRGVRNASLLGTGGNFFVSIPTGYTINSSSSIDDTYGIYFTSVDANFQGSIQKGTSTQLWVIQNFNQTPRAYSTVNFPAGSAHSIKSSFPVTQFSGATSVYTSNNSDTDWAACNFSTLAWQGLGTVTNNLQCKRNGSDLLMKGYFTTGTVTASTMQFLLPTWNGVQLSTKSGISSPTVGGRLVRNTAITAAVKDYTVYFSPSQNFMFVSYPEYTQAVSPLSAQQGNTSLSSSEIESVDLRIPIEGWNNSNIIIGSFNGLQSCASTLSCTDTFSANISAAGVVSKENTDWINGNASVSNTSDYAVSFNTSLVTTPMNCVVTIATNAAASIAVINEANNLSTGLTVRTATSATGTLLAQPFTLVCQKQGADYLGRTAMAVASDQNVRSIGSTNVDIQSVYFGSGANCATACSTGTCTICRQVGNKITSITFVSTGTYEANGIDGLNKYSCSGNGFIGGNYGVINHDLANSTTAKARLNTGAGASTANAAYAQLTCIGVP